MDRRPVKPHSIRSPPRTIPLFWIELTKDYLGKKAGERLALDEKDAQPLITSGIAKPVAEDPLNAASNRAVDAVLAAAQQLSQKNGHKIIFGVDAEGDIRKSFGDWLLGVARNDRGYLSGATRLVRASEGPHFPI
jgi:hypothetical protein